MHIAIHNINEKETHKMVHNLKKIAICHVYFSNE